MKKLIVMAAACLMTLAAAAQTKIVAHRGYWDCAGSAQNSITSLKLADKIGCYGSEFDVHLTKDGVIVVHHDQNVGKIDIQTSTYKALKKERLKNGEKIPTLEQYLDAGKDLSCKLVLEIKRQMIVWISFSGKACELLHQLLPDAHIQYLLGDWDPKTIKAKGLSGIDYEQKVLALHPEWIKECHDLGLVVNVWTVNDLNTINQFIKAGVDFITTNAPVEGLKLAK